MMATFNLLYSVISKPFELFNRGIFHSQKSIQNIFNLNSVDSVYAILDLPESFELSWLFG